MRERNALFNFAFLCSVIEWLGAHALGNYDRGVAYKRRAVLAALLYMRRGVRRTNVTRGLTQQFYLS